jgi:hypothetical protein
MSGEINKVVVPLDSASESDAAIDTGSSLAARVKARLHGVFIEDEDLWQLASLPFVHQVSTEAGIQPLTPESIELQWRAAAERARREIKIAAERHGIDWSFEVVRGSAATAFDCASEHDLVVASVLTRPVGGHFRVEARWWSSLDAVSGTVLLARRPWAAIGSVVIMLRDRSSRSARLLDTAATIAEAKARTMIIICEPRLARSEGFEAWLADRLAAYPQRPEIEITTGDEGDLHQRLTRLDCGLIAVEAGGADRLRASFEQLGCDLLIVR